MNLEEAKAQDTEVYCPDCLVETEWGGFTEWYECPECGDVVAVVEGYAKTLRMDEDD